MTNWIFKNKVKTKLNRGCNMLDVIKTQYGEVEIEAVEWHRGLIPLPKGTMLIDDKVVDKIAKKHKLNKKMDLVWELLDYCRINVWAVDFSSSYIEFLYPGSPNYGFNFHVDYVDESIEDCDLEDFVGYLSKEEDKEFLLKNKENIEAFLSDINDVYYQMLDDVIAYIEDLKEDVYEED
jgi:hypothetical protein